MKAILPPPTELLPAAERAQRMAGRLEVLQGEAEQLFSGMPRLLALLMQLFALLRGAADRRAEAVLEVSVPEPVVSRAARVGGVRVRVGRSLGSARVHAAQVVVQACRMATRVRCTIGRLRVADDAEVAMVRPKIFQKIGDGCRNMHVHFVTIQQQRGV